jgi:hypothetical protein
MWRHGFFHRFLPFGRERRLAGGLVEAEICCPELPGGRLGITEVGKLLVGNG